MRDVEGWGEAIVNKKAPTTFLQLGLKIGDIGFYPVLTGLSLLRSTIDVDNFKHTVRSEKNYVCEQKKPQLHFCNQGLKLACRILSRPNGTPTIGSPVKVVD
jgi:hypothetical protein